MPYRQYLFHLDTTLFYADRDRDPSGTVRLFMGTFGAPLRPVPVREVLMAKDGGSLWIHTPNGVLHIPAATRHADPLWTVRGVGHELTVLDHTRASIRESNGTVTVRL